MFSRSADPHHHPRRRRLHHQRVIVSALLDRLRPVGMLILPRVYPLGDNVLQIRRSAPSPASATPPSPARDSIRPSRSPAPSRDAHTAPGLSPWRQCSPDAPSTRAAAHTPPCRPAPLCSRRSAGPGPALYRSEEHTSELQSL